MAFLNVKINFEEGQTVKEVASSVTMNDKKIDESSVFVYKVVDNDYNYCDLLKLTPLDSNYVIKLDETYGIVFRKLDYSDTNATLQSEGEVTINGKAIEEYDHYCFGNPYNEPKVTNMSFHLVPTKSTKILVEDNTKQENTVTQDNEVTHEIVGTDTTTGTVNNNTLLYSLCGIIIALLMVIIVLLLKIKRK